MPADGEKKPKVIHRLAGIVLTVAAVILLIQCGFIAFLPDDARLEMIKGAVKLEMSNRDFVPPERPPTDRELDQRLADNRETLLQESKRQARSSSDLYMKAVVALLMLVIAFFLFKNKRGPARLLAVIVVVLLGMGTITAFDNFSQEKEVFKYVAASPFLTTWYYLDIGLLAVMPLGLLFGLLTAINPPGRVAEKAAMPS